MPSRAAAARSRRKAAATSGWAAKRGASCWTTCVRTRPVTCSSSNMLRRLPETRVASRVVSASGAVLDDVDRAFGGLDGQVDVADHAVAQVHGLAVGLSLRDVVARLVQ